VMNNIKIAKSIKCNVDTDSCGTKRWYKDGKLHREGGPAMEDTDGSKFWYYYGKRHRDDGPAIEYYDGRKIWFFHGEFINCKSQEEFIRIIKLAAFW
jgi:hypothetical protein